MAYDLADYIEIPEPFDQLPDWYLKGIVASCKSMCEPLIPYKTGYLLSCFDCELLNGEVVVYVEGCPYAVYLNEDIVKTAGWFDTVLAIFETAFLAALYNDTDTLQTVYDEASFMIQTQQYGLVYKTKLENGEVENINMGRM